MTSEFVGTVPPKKHTKTRKRFIVDVVVVVAPTMGYTFLTYRNSITKQNAHVTNRRLLCGPSGQAGTMPVSSAITVAAPGRSGGYRSDRGGLGDTAPAIRTGRSPARTAHRIAFTTQLRKAVPHGNYIGQMGYMWNNGLHCNCIGQTTNVEVCGTMGYIATTLDKWDTLWNT